MGNNDLTATNDRNPEEGGRGGKAFPQMTKIDD